MKDTFTIFFVPFFRVEGPRLASVRDLYVFFAHPLENKDSNLSSRR